MKKITSVVIFFIIFSICFTACNAEEEIPQRASTKVTNVFDTYTPKEWIVSAAEEEPGNSPEKAPPECDIKCIASAYDDNYLRIDILLYNPVPAKSLAMYTLSIQERNGVAYKDLFEYTPYSKSFRYGTPIRRLCYDKDSARLSGDNRVICMIINKDQHFSLNNGWEKGQVSEDTYQWNFLGFEQKP